MLTASQKKILEFVQGDLGLEERPFKALAEALRMSEGAVVREIRQLKKQGYIRRFGALLDHRRIGLHAHCMCVWQVPQKKVGKIGRVCRNQPEISHCYVRKNAADWPYNFYTMIHCRSKAECLRLIRRIAAEIGVEEYRPLFTVRQFKKTSPRYSL